MGPARSGILQTPIISACLLGSMQNTGRIRLRGGCGTAGRGVPSLVTVLTLAFLFLAGLAAGFVDSIAGGGGLISIPALLSAGLSPHVALGTNKFQSSSGTLIAVLRYRRAGMMRTPWLWLAVAAAFPASFCGAWVATIASNDILRKVIPWLLAVVAVATALNPRIGLHPGRQRLGPTRFAIVFGLGLGIYDGFFGPGVGTFGTIACIAALGLDFRHATGYVKAANLASNLGALVLFLLAGSVNHAAGASMIAGQLIGAQLGSGFVIRHGVRFIRPVFLCVVFALTVKLMVDAWGNGR